MILTPRQEQARDLLNSQSQHILLDGGSRSGKTAVIVRNICVRALKAPKSRHGIVRFHFKDVKEAIGMDTLPKVMQLCFPDVRYTLNRSDWFMLLPNHAEVWLLGVDDKERTDKVLGKEFVTLFFNECSQIPYASRSVAMTRLAQRVIYELEGRERVMALKAYYDQNPPSKGHWGYQLFHLKRDPDSKRPLEHPEQFATMSMHPKDNEANLAPGYISQVLEALPARERRRFLDGAYGEVAPGALWSEEILDRWRVGGEEMPDLQRVVVAVDPSGSDEDDNADNDEIGIMVGALGVDGNGYLLEDLTLKAGPKTWGGVVAHAFDRHEADAIVGEVNYGGAMVKYVIETQPAEGRVRPFKMLTASRGKVVRAEPISALHERGKVRLVGRFSKLEEELCSFTTHGYVGEKSPNRADAFVWLMSELFPGMVKEKPKAKRVARPYAGSWQS